MAGKRDTTDSGNADNIDNGAIESGGEANENGNGNSGVIDPASIEYGDDFERDGNGQLVYGASGKPRRKRGRKSGGNNAGNASGSGSTTKSSAKGNTQNLAAGLETLSQTLLIVHLGIASWSGFDKFALEKSEGDALAASVANVLEQFDWTPDPRFTAIAGLVTTASMIYGPRIYLYREHVKAKAKKEVATQSEMFNVTALNIAPLQ